MSHCPTHTVVPQTSLVDVNKSYQGKQTAIGCIVSHSKSY